MTARDDVSSTSSVFSQEQTASLDSARLSFLNKNYFRRGRHTLAKIQLKKTNRGSVDKHYVP